MDKYTLPELPLIVEPALISKHRVRSGVSKELMPDKILEGMETAVGHAKESCARIHAAAGALVIDPTKTHGENVVRIVTTTDKLALTAVERLDAARSMCEAELQSMKRQSWSPPGPPNQNAMHIDSEVRAVCRSLDDRAREKFIRHALSSDSDDVLRAIFSGPSVLCGLSDENREMYRAEWRKRRHGPIVNREARLQSALKALDLAGGGVVGFVKSMHEAFESRDAADKIVARSQAARAAIEGVAA